LDDGEFQVAENVRTTQVDGRRRSEWWDYERLQTLRKVYTNPFNRRVGLLVEARSPHDRNFIRIVAGRQEARSPVGVSRQFFYEDIPHIINALIEIYDSCKEYYISSEEERMRKDVERELRAVQQTVSHDREDWTGRLAEIQSHITTSLDKA
jgi:hypothetical protein